MTQFFKGTVIKEIFWNNKSYPMGSTIIFDEYDRKELSESGVVADIFPYATNQKVEFAVKEAAENTMRPYKKRGKRS